MASLVNGKRVSKNIFPESTFGSQLSPKRFYHGDFSWLSTAGTSNRKKYQEVKGKQDTNWGAIEPGGVQQVLTKTSQYDAIVPAEKSIWQKLSAGFSAFPQVFPPAPSILK